MKGAPRTELLRLFAVVFVWAALFRLLSAYGVDLLPRSFARELTLEAYLALVQVVTLALGLVLSFALLRAPRRELALTSPRLGTGVYAVALTPAVFIVATGAAFQIARPTLLAELAHGGLAEVQKNTGEFGRELTHAPSALAFLWGAFISPLGEELFFRGAFFTLVLGVTTALRRDETSHDETARGDETSRSAAARLLSGSLATLVVALVFGYLHRDMPGGLGIVRFVSALGLGLACGVARQLGGSVVPPMLVHVGFNALSLATARRLVVSETFPMKSGVPTLVAAVAGIAAWAVALHFLFARRRRRTR